MDKSFYYYINNCGHKDKVELRISSLVKVIVCVIKTIKSSHNLQRLCL